MANVIQNSGTSTPASSNTSSVDCQLSLITSTVFEKQGSENWYLPKPIKVQLSVNGFEPPLEIHGIAVLPTKVVYIYTLGGNNYFPEELWHKIDPTEINADKIIAAIHNDLLKALPNEQREVAA